MYILQIFSEIKFRVGVQCHQQNEPTVINVFCAMVPEHSHDTIPKNDLYELHVHNICC